MEWVSVWLLWSKCRLFFIDRRISVSKGRACSYPSIPLSWNHQFAACHTSLQLYNIVLREHDKRMIIVFRRRSKHSALERTTRWSTLFISRGSTFFEIDVVRGSRNGIRRGSNSWRGFALLWSFHFGDLNMRIFKDVNGRLPPWVTHWLGWRHFAVILII